MRAILVGLVLAVTMVACAEPTIDRVGLEQSIEDWVENSLGVWPGTTRARCPDDAPSDSGYQFICTIEDDSGVFSLRVTVLNETGDVEWEVLG